ncbi:hypothetical protein V1514DRAFT_289093 [Lipomyces japonicus]|uniref:uncharacterized protein n=1 Tax=Lipomyces japonicus TaxID=56871 RepID=UPI0034CD6D1E
MNRTPLRHPANNLDKEIEIWDDDVEIEFAGHDLFHKLSQVEDRDDVSSSFMSSRNSTKRTLLSQFDHDENDDDGGLYPAAEDDAFVHQVSKTSSANLNSSLEWNNGGTIKHLGTLKANSKPGIDSWDDELDFADQGKHYKDLDILTLKPSSKKNRDARLVVSDIIGGNLFTAPTPSSNLAGTLKGKPAMVDPIEDFELDFDLPEDLSTINLRAGSGIIRTPLQLAESDNEGWGDESTSSRFTSSRRDPLSSRNSLISSFSPASSSVTYESEDDGLYGLQFPDGPMDWQKHLDRILNNSSPPDHSQEDALLSAKDDFLEGLEIGDDDIFHTARRTINRNIKQKTTFNNPTPQKKPSIASIFPQKPASAAAQKPTRIPRPIQPSASFQQLPTIQSTPKHDQVNGLAQVGTPNNVARRLSHKSSMISVKSSAKDSAARSLLSKKSMPSLRTSDSTFYNGNNNNNNDNKSNISTPPIPSIPSWLAQTQTQTQTGSNTSSLPRSLSTRNLKRVVSKSSLIPPPLPPPASTEPLARPKDLNQSNHILSKFSRKSLTSFIDEQTTSTPVRYKSPSKSDLLRDAPSTKTLLKPVKRRLFGDGTELDNFEDLPINSTVEPEFIRKSGRNIGMFAEKLSSNSAQKEKLSLASQNGRLPLQSSRTTSLKEKNSQQGKSRKKVQQRPHLIKPLGDVANISKSEKGMRYNPKTFKWEGNENIITEFDNIMLTPPRPALISNITSNKGVQVVGGMVFDPVRMCWFKAHEDGSTTDEDDPFEGVDDLVEDVAKLNMSTPKVYQSGFTVNSGPSSSSTSRRRTAESFGEFVVGEEFDVGPEFRRRQRDEEERWKRKVEGWMAPPPPPSRRDNGMHNREYLYEIKSLIKKISQR